MIGDDFLEGNSIIHRLDPRVRLVVAGLFSIIVAISDRFPALVTSFFMALILVILADLPFKKVGTRLLFINILIFLIWLVLPFTFGGETLFSLGPLNATKEGITYCARITIKSNSIILTLMALLSTMPIHTMGKAMRMLYVPGKMVHLLLFTYRYIHAIHREYGRLMNTIKIRGFQPGTTMHTYRTFAHLIGVLLVRSYDRGERVHAAMLCRGFRGKYYDLTELAMKPADLIMMALMLLALSGIGVLQWTKIIY